MGANNKEFQALTPQLVGSSRFEYKIPIYQRLFEWDSEKIEQLLNDLYNSYSKNNNENYYIGMLTSENSNDSFEYNLVDGQQRFVVMMLFGIEMEHYYAEWEKFLIICNDDSKKNMRLSFSARENDNLFLAKMCHGKGEIGVLENEKMMTGINAIKKWLESKSVANLKEFCKYIYEHMTFFVSELPQGYLKKDLNKYFERMNSAGKNLENYEILKVECLKKLNNSHLSKEVATFIWNTVEQMDKMLIRDKEGESTENRRVRIKNALTNIINGKVDKTLGYFNDKMKDTNNVLTHNEEDNKIILSVIEESKGSVPIEPVMKRNSMGETSLLKFTEFLLLILYLRLGVKERKDVKIDDFFDSSKLIETYKIYLLDIDSVDMSSFFVDILKYRLIYDYIVIRKEGENENSSFELDNIEDNDNGYKRKLIKYQSMLYAGTTIKTYYRWLVPYLEYVSNNVSKSNNKNLLENLKKNDNIVHPIVSVNSLNYNYSDIVYYLRRLDYYLWEKNEDITVKDDIISKFNFVKGGRSVEHLHPQDQTNNENWELENVHRLGNLFLISSSFNSTQSNDSINVKFGRIKDQICLSRLESIKLYAMYKDSGKDELKWTIDVMIKHEKEMYEILKKSYEIF